MAAIPPTENSVGAVVQAAQKKTFENCRASASELILRIGGVSYPLGETSDAKPADTVDKSSGDFQRQ